jgi:hypothetical protein
LIFSKGAAKAATGENARAKAMIFFIVIIKYNVIDY